MSPFRLFNQNFIRLCYFIICATCLVHLTLLDLITLMMFVEECLSRHVILTYSKPTTLLWIGDWIYVVHRGIITEFEGVCV